jgi:hypothetical protein
MRIVGTRNAAIQTPDMALASSRWNCRFLRNSGKKMLGAWPLTSSIRRGQDDIKKVFRNSRL